MLSPTLFPLLALLASCAAPVAKAQAEDCQVPPRAPSFFKPGVKWQIEIQDPIRVPANSAPVIPTDAKVWDVDMFQAIEYNVIPRLRAANGEIFVICYFNAGGLDKESDPDADEFRNEDILGKIPDWDEFYLDITSANVTAIMRQRIDDGIAAGCDGFDPDNIDGYLEPTLVTRPEDMYTLTPSDYYDYVKALADYTHAQGKLLGQKNARELLNLDDGRGLLRDDVVDFAVTEQCTEAPAWCDRMKPFIAHCKPVFQIEYPTEWDHANCRSPALNSGTRSKYCPPVGDGFSTILKLDGDDCGLNGVAQYCDSDVVVTTPTDTED